MAKKRVFTSFDFDNDDDLRTMLMGQAKNSDTPFDVADWSLKAAISGDWKEKVRARIKQVDQVIVVCGEKTDTATGVSIELKMAQEEGKPYFLLYGRSSKTCVKPVAAKATDKMYNWTWDNLKSLINGAR